jgi:RsiW-degrading membrane proteinase PrsW (M82 family)/RNA polymerase subunit RPABC4/transcription elongation factor Spt4
VWLLYFRWRSDRFGTAFLHVLRVFIWGCFCTIPAGLIEYVTGAILRQDTFLTSTAVGFLLIAPIEEFSKLIAVWAGVYRSRHFTNPMHGLIFAATAGCAFASIENVVYMALLGPEIFVLRLVYATPAHIMFSVMWGYSLGVARFRKDGELVKVGEGLTASILLHGIYNAIVAYNASIAVVSLIPLMLFMGWLTSHLVSKLRGGYPYEPLGDGLLVLCPNCGVLMPEQASHCSRCGFRVPGALPDTPRFCARCRAPANLGFEVCPACGSVLKNSSDETNCAEPAI